MRKIQRSPGPVFFYSNFKGSGGIESFIKVLEYHGYSDYAEYGEGRKRYAVWTGDVKQDMRQEIKEVFNQPENSNGSRIRVLLGSSSSKEGLSLKGVRQVHILEPYWNWSRMLQVIGRGNRYCSHKLLDPEDRKLDVFIYLATHYNEMETIDQYIQKLAMQKDKLINQFEIAMKEAAIDCDLFKNANVYKGEDDIECEV
jgi:superfamily II DNA/RNA helicase